MRVVSHRRGGGVLCAMVLVAALVSVRTEAAGFVAREDGVDSQSGVVRMRVTAITDDVLRVRIAPSGDFGEDASWAVRSDWRTRSVKVSVAQAAQQPGIAEFRTANLAIRIQLEPLRLIVSDLAGHEITTDSSRGAITTEGAGFSLRKVLPESEHFFGLGDKVGRLDHRGQTFTNWNTDAYGFGESSDPLYKSIPFFVAAGGPAGSYGIFLDNTWRTWFDFGKRDPHTLAFGSTAGPIDYYVIHGPSTRHVIERYTDLTGKPPLPPLWELGFQQSRYSYMSADEVSSVARRLRSERIPTDVMWLDIDYQDHNRPFTTNPRTFPDMAALVSDLSRQDLRLVAITDLHIPRLLNQGYAPYETGVAGDHFVKRPDGSTYIGEVWPGLSAFPEFTRSVTRAWWGEQYRGFINAGIAGFWNDMNEPAVFNNPGKTMPLDNVHRIAEPGFAERAASHEEIHNIYGMLNTRATFEGMQRLRPDERPFVMTRASAAGGQRYAVTWTGDNSSTWNHLKLAITQMLNLGMSGFAYSGADVGGFKGTPSPDLLTKWIEVAAFTPIFRVHSVNDSPHREPWLDGAEHTNIRRRFIEARYRLMPYLYALADENARTGAPLMRPLFYEFPESLESKCDAPTSFLLGAQLLIAPPPDFESPAAYPVCFPAGEWFDYWTGGKVVRSGPRPQTLTVTPALDRLPVFVRAGAILPQQPLVQSTAQIPHGVLSLDIYPGDECRGVIYADDGHSMAYLNQGYLRQAVRCSASRTGIVVNFDAREGQYRPWWQQIEIRVHRWNGAADARLDGHTVAAHVVPRSDILSVRIDAPHGPSTLSISAL
jgi:alpha-glucosidase